MKFKALFFISAFFICSQSFAVSNKEICDTRAELLFKIAQARDEGVSKKQVKSFIERKYKIQLPAAFDIYVDATYEGRKYNPDEIKTISLYSCYKEYWIIK